MNQLVECVPNFSEGRDKGKIKQITDSIEKIPGIQLLDVDIGSDTNRTVVTFIGSPKKVEEVRIAIGADEDEWLTGLLDLPD